jgi:hypothetical protein
MSYPSLCRKEFQVKSSRFKVQGLGFKGSQQRDRCIAAWPGLWRGAAL